MANVVLMLIVLLTIAFTPWIESLRSNDFHHIDLMVGDEGGY